MIGRPLRRDRGVRRRERRRRDLQAIFARTMASMDSEAEAHDLVKRHLERSLAASKVVVLQRNNSADRLIATTELEGAEPLRTALRDAEPRDCLAVRLNRPHVRDDEDELLQCGVCGKLATDSAVCTPLIVSGEVTGAVLVGHDRPLDPGAQRFIDDTVTQAAPVLANMRNLAIAELRASTDALTGLANRRAVQDTIRRMVAQAARTGLPLAIVAIDVDHFKRINDLYGHDRGDDVLAAVGQTLAGTLRQAIEALDALGQDDRVTASFGVAAMPDDGVDPQTLMRQADRALYAAKANGRNRVEAAASSGSPAVA